MHRATMFYCFYHIYYMLLSSGRYLGQTGLQSVIIPGAKVSMREDIPTIGTLFQDAGYATYLIGKWHLGMCITFLNSYDDLSSRITIP